MSIDLMPGFGAFTQSAALLDGSEADGTNVLPGGVGMTTGWSTVNGTLTNATTTASDGTTTASTFEDNANDNRHIVYSQIGASSVGVAVISIYAKQNTLRYLQMLPSDSSGFNKGYVYADLQTGTITDSGNIGTATVNSTSIQAGANGFWKITMNITFDRNGSYIQFATSTVSTYGAPLTENSPQYVGSSQSVYLWRPKMVLL